MTQFSKEAICNRINRSYNPSQLAGNGLFTVVLLAFVLTFPEAFEVIKYPPGIPLFISIAALIIYVFTYIAVQRSGMESDEEVRRLVKIDQHSTYYRNMTTLILLPAFGEQYAHLFWFAAALASAPIFVSTFISHRMKQVSVFSPFITLVIHYLYWNLPMLFTGDRFTWAKSIQPVEIGFSIILVVLFYLAYKELNQSYILSSNFTFDDRIIESYVNKHGLTDREKDVLIKVLQGKPSKQIGEELFISPGTVRNHLSNIFAKTGTHSRLELASRTYASPQVE